MSRCAHSSCSSSSWPVTYQRAAPLVSTPPSPSVKNNSVSSRDEYYFHRNAALAARNCCCRARLVRRAARVICRLRESASSGVGEGTFCPRDPYLPPTAVAALRSRTNATKGDHHGWRTHRPGGRYFGYGYSDCNDVHLLSRPQIENRRANGCHRAWRRYSW